VMLGHVALADAANLLLPRLVRGINCSEARRQGDKHGGGAARERNSTVCRCKGRGGIESMERAQRKGGGTGFQEGAAIEHWNSHRITCDGSVTANESFGPLIDA
ncbi:MAG: hypothetical protein WCE63_11470, partial [Acidobacteriaceae bacterium]